MNIIIAILIFGIIIIVHELGHFLIAKKNGIQVDEFCIGLGPTIIGKQVGETFYSVKLLPFGGACMMGEDEDRPEENAFNNKSVWARMAVIFGGPFFNFILAFIFSIIVIGMSGADIPKISKVEKDSPAYEAGIRKGDIMIKVAGKKMHNYREFSYYMYLDYDGGKIPITIFIQKVKEKNIHDDMLSRTSSKYAIVTLTIRLINSRYKDRGIILDIEGIRELLVDTEINSINRRGIKRKAEDWLIQYIESNASKFKSGKETNTNVDYWGTRKELPNGELEVAILTNKFEEIMRKGKFEDTKVVLEQLKKEGKLEYEAGRLTRKRKVNAIQTPVYVIRLSQ